MVKSGQEWAGLLVTRDATGALAAPSAGPVGALYVNGVVNAAAVTVSGANPYKWTVTLPALTAGDCVSMYVTATIATIATAAVVAEDVSDTSRLSDGVAVASITAGAITAAAIADDAIDAASIATGALTADAFAADAIVAATLATGAIAADALATDAVNEIVDQVWNEATADHVTAGSTGKALGDAGAAGDPWAAATRTLTSSAAATVAAMSGSALSVTRSVTYGATISGLTIPATWTAVYLTAKSSTSLPDTAAQIQILESNPGVATDGLQYIHGNTAADAGLVAADASLTVSQAAGTIAIVIDDEATAEMVNGTYSYDVKCLLADGTSQQLSGNATFTVADAVTETV